MAKKPSGTIGQIRAGIIDGQHFAEQQKIIWPSDQKEIERKILGFFVREFEKTGAKFLKIEDGGTEELDFLLTLPGGKAWLELMEVVMPKPRNTPFQSGQQWHEPLIYAENIFKAVEEKKIRKYGLNHETPIDLLLYITHEQYAPNEAAIHALRHFFKENTHPFNYIFLILPFAEDHCDLRVIFNVGHPFEIPPLEELAERKWLSLPSSGFTVAFGNENTQTILLEPQ